MPRAAAAVATPGFACMQAQIGLAATAGVLRLSSPPSGAGPLSGVAGERWRTPPVITEMFKYYQLIMSSDTMSRKI